MAVGPIPFSSIDRYATRYEISHIDDFERFRGVIRALDGAYLEKEAPLEEGHVPPTNVGGVKALLASFRARAERQEDDP